MVIFKTSYVQSFVFLYSGLISKRCTVISVLRTNITVLYNFMAIITLPVAKYCEKKP